jgi:hypothetical protein
MAEYRAGRVKSIPWAEVRAWLHRETNPRKYPQIL